MVLQTVSKDRVGDGPFVLDMNLSCRTNAAKNEHGRQRRYAILACISEFLFRGSIELFDLHCTNSRADIRKTFDKRPEDSRRLSVLPSTMENHSIPHRSRPEGSYSSMRRSRLSFAP